MNNVSFKLVLQPAFLLYNIRKALISVGITADTGPCLRLVQYERKARAAGNVYNIELTWVCISPL
jgi:hypothetical protein